MNPSRICVKCGGKSIVLSYTKKGLMSVMCSKCGKSWECKVEGCCGRD
jgi:hypothetical protein